MSAQSPVKRINSAEISARKGASRSSRSPPITRTPRRIADPYVDFLLVGDSLGMVMHGYETTVPVPLELMIMHGRAVMRGAQARAGRRRHAVRLL